MDQTIRVSGEKETEIRVKLKEVEEDLKKTALLKWNIKAPLYDRIFFVVFREKDRLVSSIQESMSFFYQRI